MHNKCDAHESSPHHPAQSVKKLSPTKMVPGARKLGDCCIKGLVSKIYKVLLLLLLLLSRFSCVRLCATQRRQPTRLPVPGILQALVFLIVSSRLRGKSCGDGCRDSDFTQQRGWTSAPGLVKPGSKSGHLLPTLEVFKPCRQPCVRQRSPPTEDGTHPYHAQPAEVGWGGGDMPPTCGNLQVPEKGA